MLRRSHPLLGLLLVFSPDLAARADTVPGVTVERVVRGGREGQFAVDLLVNVKGRTAILIDEVVPEPLVAANMSDGGVLLGPRIVWTALLDLGLYRFSYTLVIPDCAGDFPVGPGTFQVGDVKCRIDGDERGDCTKPLLQPEETPFRRGDFDQGGGVDISDVISLLNYLFLGGPGPSCEDGADADDNGSIELSDAIRILDWIFLGGMWLPDPGSQACGPDPTPDLLGCAKGC